MLIGKDNVTANGVSYWEINTSHNERKALMTGKFKSTGDNVSFRESVRLKGLNGFFDMARYVKRLDNDP
jgi:hypothetical protein